MLNTNLLPLFIVLSRTVTGLDILLSLEFESTSPSRKLAYKQARRDASIISRYYGDTCQVYALDGANYTLVQGREPYKPNEQMRWRAIRALFTGENEGTFAPQMVPPTFGPAGYLPN